MSTAAVAHSARAGWRAPVVWGLVVGVAQAAASRSRGLILPGSILELWRSAAEADTPTIAAGIGPQVVPSSTLAMTTGRTAELAGRQGDRGRSLFTFRDG